MRLVTLFTLAALLIGCGTNVSRHAQRDARSGGQAASVDWPDVSMAADVAPDGVGDVAVIVAVEDYTFLPDVPGAVQNAEDWRVFLKENLGVGKIYTLYDSDASREEMIRFASRAADEVKNGAKIWFVFVGHGAPSGAGEGMLVGMDAQQTVASLASRSARQEELLSVLESSSAGNVVMVVDACFSGRDGGGELLAKGSQPVVPVEEPEVATKAVVLSAARPSEFAGALPRAERPAFSYLLLGALRGWADDGDGYLRAEEAVTWTRSQLAHVKGRTQTPTLHGNGRVVLSRSAREADPGITDLMRGQPKRAAAQAEAEPAVNVYDTDRGMIIRAPKEWELFSSTPAIMSDDGMDFVAEYHLGGRADHPLFLYYMRYGANSFRQNVETMEDGFAEKGTRKVRQITYEIDGDDALVQFFEGTREDGVPIFLILMYRAYGEELWMTHSVVPMEHKESFIRANDAFWNGMDGPD